VRDERGSALVWALMLLVLASALGATLLERGRAVAAATEHDRTTLRGFFAAEGGLAFARHALARDPAYHGGTVRVGECDVAVTVQPRGRAWDVTAVADGVRLVALFRDVPGTLPPMVEWRQDR